MKDLMNKLKNLIRHCFPTLTSSSFWEGVGSVMDIMPSKPSQREHREHLGERILAQRNREDPFTQDQEALARDKDKVAMDFQEAVKRLRKDKE